jgi:hypothetical protein
MLGIQRTDHSAMVLKADGQAGVRTPAILMVAMFLVAMVPLLMTPVAPLIDFYNHLARFFVLSHIGGSSFLRDHYAAHWALLPNIGVDILGTALLDFLPPLIAGHLIIALLLALQYGGVLYFHRQLTGRTSPLVALLLLPFLYSYVLNWGFANFLLGLGLAFWSAGWWLAYRDRPLLAIPVSCLLALLIFFSHGIAFAMYGIMVATLEFGLFLQERRRNWTRLAWHLALLGAQAALPLVLFVLWQSGATTGVAVATAPQAVEPFYSRLIHGFSRHIDPVIRVAEGPALWFDAVTLLAMIVFAAMLVWRKRIAVTGPARPLVAAALILALIPIPTLFSVGHIADRTPLFAILVALGSLSVRSGAWTRNDRFAATILGAIVFLRLGAVAWDWHNYGDTYREYAEIARHIPSGHTVAPVMIDMGHHETIVPRTEMYGPLLVPLYNQAVPLFSDERQQPLLLTGALRTSAMRLRAPPLMEDGVKQDYGSYMESAAVVGFDYLLICNADLLEQSFPANTSVVARTAHFALLKTVR